MLLAEDGTLIGLRTSFVETPVVDPEPAKGGFDTRYISWAADALICPITDCGRMPRSRGDITPSINGGAPGLLCCVKRVVYQFIYNLGRGKSMEWKLAEELLEAWYYRAAIARNAHRLSGKYYGKMHWTVGAAIVILSALTGTTIASSLQTGDLGKWIVSGLTALTALLAAFQTFKRPDEIAQRHEVARARFAGLCRHIEQILVLEITQRGSVEARLTEIRRNYDQLANLNTPYPERYHKLAVKQAQPFSIGKKRQS